MIPRFMIISARTVPVGNIGNERLIDHQRTPVDCYY